ncbi:MAG: hypothetical protein AB7F79_00815 [Steroidobacteraceae bacterium]
MQEVAQTPLDSEWATPISSGSELFVINLCASMTPMPALPKQLKGYEKYRLYQISRQEDGRRRYRLRLGFFSSEADAEMVVSLVRSLYPAAFTGCAGSEDQRHVFDATAVNAAVITPAATAASAPRPSELELLPELPTTPTPAENSLEATAKQPALTTLLNLVPEPESVAIEPSKATAAASKPRATVAKQTPPALKPVDKPAINPIVSASIVSSPLSRKIGDMPLANRMPKVVDDYVPVLDTTLTIRALTRAEADDPSKPKWFVVQLALSEQPVNLDAMPKLDIFVAYSLYSVALMEGGTIRHALRLGFFREQVSAEAVMGYLKTFFAAPTISQISASEHDRFVGSKPARATPSLSKVVSLDNKRETSPQQVATTPPAAAAQNPAKVAAKSTATQRSQHIKVPLQRKLTTPVRQQSFLSRLIGRQLD